MPGAEEGKWDVIQQKTFTRWVNTHLKERMLKVENIQTDFANGIQLINLLEIISSKSLGKYNKKPKLRPHWLENNLAALNFLKAEGIKLVGIGAEDICDGKIKLILGLIWTIILRYQINVSSSGEGGSSSSARSDLLKWVQSKIPDYNIKNFSSNWNDGRAICALGEALLPGQCPNHKQMDPKDSHKNAETGLTNAKKNMGIPEIVGVEDMVHEGVDELSMMTYISYFRDWERVQKEKEEQAKKDAEEKAKQDAEQAKLDAAAQKEKAAKQQAEEEERTRKEAEAKKAEEEERKRKEAEAKKAAEEERKRKEAEAKKAKKDADAKKKAEQEKKKKEEEEEAARKRKAQKEAEEAAKRKAEAEAAKQKKSSEPEERFDIKNEEDLKQTVRDLVYRIYHHKETGFWKRYDPVFDRDSFTQLGRPGWDAKEDSQKRTQARELINKKKNDEIYMLMRHRFAQRCMEEVKQTLRKDAPNLKKKPCRQAVYHHIEDHMNGLVYKA